MIDEQPDEDFPSLAQERTDTGGVARNATIIVVGEGSSAAALMAAMRELRTKMPTTIQLAESFQHVSSRLNEASLSIQKLSESLSHRFYPTETGKQKAQWKQDRRLSKKWGRR